MSKYQLMGTRLDGNPVITFSDVVEPHTCSITNEEIPEGMPCVFIESPYKKIKRISSTAIISAEGIRKLMHAIKTENFEQSFITKPKRSTSIRKCPVCLKEFKRNSESIALRGVTDEIFIHYECTSDLYNLLQKSIPLFEEEMGDIFKEFV